MNIFEFADIIWSTKVCGSQADEEKGRKNNHGEHHCNLGKV